MTALRRSRWPMRWSFLLEGKVAQTGSVRQVFSRPASLAVAGLLTVETVQPDAS